MSDRKEHWENVYRNKSPDEVSWYQQEPTLSLQLIGSVPLPLDAPIIDVGGGASTLVDKLWDEGFTNISVLDVSGCALAHARDRLAAKLAVKMAAGLVDGADAMQWFEEDVTCFNPPRRFALWHDRAVFHFLTDKADRDSYVSVLKQALEPGGHLIIMTFAIDGPLKCSGLEIVRYDADKLKTALGPGFELEETGHETHKTPSGGQQKFAYFRFTFTP
jgi:SAM-dependent methyltransferase